MFNSHDMFEESTLFLRTHRVSLDVLVHFDGLQWTVTIFLKKSPACSWELIKIAVLKSDSCGYFYLIKVGGLGHITSLIKAPNNSHKLKHSLGSAVNCAGGSCDHEKNAWSQRLATFYHGHNKEFYFSVLVD